MTYHFADLSPATNTVREAAADLLALVRAVRVLAAADHEGINARALANLLPAIEQRAIDLADTTAEIDDEVDRLDTEQRQQTADTSTKE